MPSPFYLKKNMTSKIRTAKEIDNTLTKLAVGKQVKTLFEHFVLSTVLNYPAILILFEEIKKIKEQIDLSEPMNTFLLRANAANGFSAFCELLALEEKLLKIRVLLEKQLNGSQPVNLKMVMEIACHTSEMQLTSNEIAFLQQSKLEDLGFWFNVSHHAKVLSKVLHYIDTQVLPLKQTVSDEITV